MTCGRNDGGWVSKVVAPIENLGETRRGRLVDVTGQDLAQVRKSELELELKQGINYAVN